MDKTDANLMIDLQEIDNTITELENGNLTFSSCNKLASLYIIRSQYVDGNTVVKEYNDILPSYTDYCNIKRKFQLGECNNEIVLNSIQILCLEIQQFINSIYSSTDLQEEREQLNKMINNIKLRM